MPIFKLMGSNITKLKETTFSFEGINEARDLQEFIINSIETIEEDLFVLSSEYGNWEISRRRIDILCIDKDANLVVIELKRTEDGGHMELQSLRYAAMVANMTFDKAESAYRDYLKKHNIERENPQKEILDFLGWEEINEEDFANNVRIILVSADFSKEITTSVLWLNERDIDIKCIRIKPQKDGDNLYFDIQQIIPLPEAAEYQVKLKEKEAEKRHSRNRDYSRYDITINGETESNLNKRETMYFVIKESVNSGISPEKLMESTGERRWVWVDEQCQTKSVFDEICKVNNEKYDPKRWFNKDEELILFDGKTYAYTNQQGKETRRLVEKIFDDHPELNGKITKSNE